MTNDQFWRIVLGAIIFAAISAFWPQLTKWIRRMGYTGWK